MSLMPFDLRVWLAENMAANVAPEAIRAELIGQSVPLAVIDDELALAYAHPYIQAAKNIYQRSSAVQFLAIGNRPMDEEWQGWTRDNLARNCNPTEIQGILLKNQFSLAAIQQAMGEHFPGIPGMEMGVDYKRLCARPVVHQAKAFPSGKAQLFEIDGFLNDAECDQLIALIGRKQRPSKVTDDYAEKTFRTSMTCDLGLLNEPAVAAIDQKIADMLGLNLSYSEGIQGQHYKIGQQFKPHTDYFEPDGPEYAKHAAAQGNRTWTFMIYLNEVEKGGGTHFTRINTIITPKRGSAVIWNNLYENGQPNPDTMHAGLPVEAGEKFIITKWFREKGTGNMFTEAMQ